MILEALRQEILLIGERLNWAVIWLERLVSRQRGLGRHKVRRCREHITQKMQREARMVNRSKLEVGDLNLAVFVSVFAFPRAEHRTSTKA